MNTLFSPNKIVSENDGAVYVYPAIPCENMAIYISKVYKNRVFYEDDVNNRFLKNIKFDMDSLLTPKLFKTCMITSDNHELPPSFKKSKDKEFIQVQLEYAGVALKNMDTVMTLDLHTMLKSFSFFLEDILTLTTTPHTKQPRPHGVINRVINLLFPREVATSPNVDVYNKTKPPPKATKKMIEMVWPPKDFLHYYMLQSITPENLLYNEKTKQWKLADLKNIIRKDFRFSVFNEGMLKNDSLYVPPEYTLVYELQERMRRDVAMLSPAALSTEMMDVFDRNFMESAFMDKVTNAISFPKTYLNKKNFNHKFRSIRVQTFFYSFVERFRRVRDRTGTYAQYFKISKKAPPIGLYEFANQEIPDKTDVYMLGMTMLQFILDNHHKVINRAPKHLVKQLIELLSECINPDPYSRIDLHTFYERYNALQKDLPVNMEELPLPPHPPAMHSVKPTFEGLAPPDHPDFIGVKKVSPPTTFKIPRKEQDNSAAFKTAKDSPRTSHSPIRIHTRGELDAFLNHFKMEEVRQINGMINGKIDTVTRSENLDEIYRTYLRLEPSEQKRFISDVLQFPCSNPGEVRNNKGVCQQDNKNTDPMKAAFDEFLSNYTTSQLKLINGFLTGKTVNMKRSEHLKVIWKEYNSLSEEEKHVAVQEILKIPCVNNPGKARNMKGECVVDAKV